MGMVTLPLKAGRVRSVHLTGLGTLDFLASMVLKQIALAQPYIPTQEGGLLLGRYMALRRSMPLGA